MCPCYYNSYLSRSVRFASFNRLLLVVNVRLVDADVAIVTDGSRREALHGLSSCNRVGEDRFADLFEVSAGGEAACEA